MGKLRCVFLVGLWDNIPHDCVSLLTVAILSIFKARESRRGAERGHSFEGRRERDDRRDTVTEE